MGAVQLYVQAIVKLQSFRNSHLYPRCEEEFPPAFFASIAELNFILWSNKSLLCLNVMRTLLSLPGLGGDMRRTARNLMGDIEDCSTHGMKSPYLMGSSDWTPSAQREGKMIYKNAAAARLMGHREKARHYIGFAVRLRPNDREIMAEQIAIGKM